ncbi:MAG TPA: RNA 2',3'-cyclic phosphodiesterase [Sedimentisphaerales bacterium]|nr:RNA 2',3'-cyclic phosphodiesterase [Sedimentisphaerales bacterium]
MRVFIAIDIGEEIRAALGELQRQLQSKADVRKGDVKWVRPDSIHLTLKFLGEIKDEQVVEVCNVVKDVAGRHKNFELDVESVGHFGGSSARVLWVGCGHNCEQLHRLQKDIEEQLALAGWPEEARQFTGHLTLCRIRNVKAGAELAKLGEAFKDYKLGIISADSVSVYQSQLRPSGPIYTILANYKLQ